jgi:BirA family biotin operon repressor/biotin-[acetyl-CoA-carboxylase] ligase
MDIQIKWHNRLGSTNRFVKNEIAQHRTPAHGSLIAAYDQTDGMGRANRSWLSSPTTNLCFSLFLKTRAPLQKIPSLTMAASLAIHDVLRKKRIHAAPKWPNDLLVNGKKICGILSECMELADSNDRGIILGIGLNVNMNAEQRAQIDQPATSIFLETGSTYPLEPLLEETAEHLCYWIDRWDRDGFESYRPQWEALTGPLGRKLLIREGQNHVEGCLRGYGEHGELKLETSSGEQIFWAGEIPW